MTEDSNPTDNGLAERVNGILKGEFIEQMPLPNDLQEARPVVNHAITIYNNVRPHLSLAMKTPAFVYDNQ